MVLPDKKSVRYALGDANESGNIWGLVEAATLAAFIGSFFSAKFIKKITLRIMQIIVGIMLILAGVGMITGLF